MSELNPGIHREVLDNLQDGVLVIGVGGSIETLNPAGQRLLDLDDTDVSGQTFAEAFLLQEGLDEFTQLLMDVSANRKQTGRTTVEVKGATERSLSVATSYLLRGEKISSVIAVFSDITELEALRENEAHQHSKLQTAYQEIEDRNTELAIALRKVRFSQSLGGLLAVSLFIAAGVWSSQSLYLFESIGATEQIEEEPANELTIHPQHVSSDITLRGTLAPWRVSNVRSQISGALLSVEVDPGDRVAEGQVLATIDLSDARADYAKKKVEHSAMLLALNELENWQESAELTQARRELTKAQLAFEGIQTRINKSRFLHKEGLIAKLDYEDAEREFTSSKLDDEAAKEAFAAVNARFSEAALDNAKQAEAIAKFAVKRAKLALERGTIRAPFSGVILASSSHRNQLTAGDLLREGQDVFSIGDFSRIAIEVEADESDIVKLAKDQPVEVTGHAFRDTVMTGALAHVSSQADPASHGVPRYQVGALLDPVTAKEKAGLRIGMSAQLRITTYTNPKALVVPIHAVRSWSGKHHITVVKSDGEVEQREVEIGPTTLDSVEITAGLSAGETIKVEGYQ